MATSQLRSRLETPALPASSLAYGFSVPAPPSSTLSEDHTNFSISYSDHPVSTEPHFDIWTPSLEDLYMDVDSDSESEVSLNYLFSNLFDSDKF